MKKKFTIELEIGDVTESHFQGVFTAQNESGKPVSEELVNAAIVEWWNSFEEPQCIELLEHNHTPWKGETTSGLFIGGL